VITSLQIDGKKGLQLVDLPINEEVHKVRYCGVCGTDKHAILGDINTGKSRVLGHEIVIKEDDRLFVTPAIMPCNKCINCLEGRPNVCKKNQVIGLTCNDKRMGGWSTGLIKNQNQQLFEVPNKINEKTAVLIETMASTKIVRATQIENKSLLIIGTGSIGLVSAIHARRFNPKKIDMVGHHEQFRLIKSITDDFYQKGTSTKELDQYDVVIDAGGNTRSFDYALECTKPAGVLLESGCMVDTFPVDIANAVKKEITIKTQLGYVPNDFKWAIREVEKNRRVLNRIITHEFKLGDFRKALEVMTTKKHGKIIFKGER
jgi:threonine dehydrogenase-like Zn-dependent dehydrogenase